MHCILPKLPYDFFLLLCLLRENREFLSKLKIGVLGREKGRKQRKSEIKGGVEQS